VVIVVNTAWISSRKVSWNCRNGLSLGRASFTLQITAPKHSRVHNNTAILINYVTIKAHVNALGQAHTGTQTQHFSRNHSNLLQGLRAQPRNKYARPAVTLPADGHYCLWPVTNYTKLMTYARVCE